MQRGKRLKGITLKRLHTKTIQLSETVHWREPTDNAIYPLEIARMASAIFPNGIISGKIALALWGIILPSDCKQVDCVCLSTNDSDISIVRNDIGLFRCYPVEQANRVLVLQQEGGRIVLDGPKSALNTMLRYQRSGLSSDIVKYCASKIIYAQNNE